MSTALRLTNLITTARWLAFMLCLVASTNAPAWPSSDTASGLYVCDLGTKLLSLQLVETDDRNITGRYEEISIKDGHVERWDAAVSGAVSGATMVGAIHLVVAMPFSGELSGNELRITSSTLKATFRKTDKSGYDKSVARLNQLASDIQQQQMRDDQTKAEIQMAAQLEAYSQQLVRATAAAKNYVQHAPDVERQYALTTQTLLQLRSRQQAIEGQDGQARVARSQVYVQMQQAVMSAKMLHERVTQARDNLASASKSAQPRISQYRGRCQSTPPFVRSDAVLPRWQKDCAQLADVASGFEASSKQAGETFAHLERDWSEQHAAQDRILIEAQRAE